MSSARLSPFFPAFVVAVVLSVLIGIVAPQALAEEGEQGEHGEVGLDVAAPGEPDEGHTPEIARQAAPGAPRNSEIDGQPYTPAANPTIPDSCGLDLTLVLDASGSIQSSNAVDDVRLAAQTLLDSLTNTNSTAKVTQFATVAETLAESVQVDSETMAPGGVLQTAIDDYYRPKPPITGVTTRQYDGSGDPFDARNWDNRSSDQFTNWDQSLDTAPTDPPGDKTVGDLVVWITDGDPTAYDFLGDPDPFPAGAVGYRTNRSSAAQEQSMQRAIFEANQIKAAGTRIFGIGVGEALQNAGSVRRLEQIAGPKSSSDLDDFANINDVDVALVEDFDDLATFLEGVVHSLCSPSMTIRKLAQQVNEGPFLPAEGWDMTVTPEVPGGSFNWVLPDTAPAVSKTVTTGPDGFAQFQWGPIPDLSDSQALIQETLQPGYAGGRLGEDNDWNCSFRDEDGNVRTVSGEFSDPDEPEFLLDYIGNEIVTCDLYNSLPPLGSLTIIKDLTGDGAPFVPFPSTYTMEVTCVLDGITVYGPTDVLLELTTPDGGIVFVSDVPVGSTCTVVETDSQGATGITVTPGQVTIPSVGIPISVVVTNTYDAGSAIFDKTITGPLGDLAPDEFVVTVTCEFLGETIDPPFEVVFGPGNPGVLENLPIGATCTVTETETGGADSTTITPDQFTVTDPDTPIEVSVVNDYPAAGLVIEKELTGDGAPFVPEGTLFQVRVVCDGTPGLDAVFDVATNSPVIITGQAVGANCTVTEVGDNGAVSWTTSPDPIPPLIDGNNPIEVILTNTFETDTFTLTKLTDGPGAGMVPPGVTFPIDVDCVFLGEPVAGFDPATYTLTAGESVEVGPLPVGAECTIAEHAAAAPQGAQAIPPQTIVVGEDEDLEVTLTNVFLVGALELNKVVEGPGKPFVPAGVEYPIEVQCKFFGEPVAGFNPATLTLTDGEQATLEPLPLGAECKVLETDLMNAFGVEYRPDDVALIASAATPASVEIANGYGLGDIQVKKEITGPGAALVPDGTTFTFTVSCTFMGQTLDDRTLVLTAPGDLSGDIVGLPTGAECTMTEDVPPGVISTIEPDEFTIGGIKDIVLVEATNEFQLGSVAVEKVLDGAGAPLATGPFEIELACTYLGTDLPVQTVTLTPPGDLSGTFDDLPVGAECTVTETDDGGASNVVIDPETITVEAGDPVQVTVTNTFDAGNVVITKVIDGDAAAQVPDGTTYTIELFCTSDGDPVPGFDPVQVQLVTPGSLTQEVGPIPTDSICVATETDSNGASSVVVDPTTITVGSLTPVELTVTNTYDSGSLLIEKIIDGDADLVDGTFQFDITCQFLGTDLDPQPGTATIAPPATSVEIPGLPAGSTCTVTELAPYGGADGPAVIQPATITINANDTVEVSATNTFTEVVTPEPPDPPTPPDPPDLIESGASQGLRQLLALAAVLLTIGTLLLAGARVRRQQ